MIHRKLLERINGDHVCVGSGLVILDLVFDTDSPDRYLVRSGGSCGNVMSILSYLGWKSYPVARLGQDSGARIVLDDLTQFGVQTKFLDQERLASTPAIVEIIRNSKSGSRTHSYSLHCPKCGNYLLRYKPISQDIAERVLSELRRATVFYFDRVSRGIVNLARCYREAGALVVFEPSSMREMKLFKEAANLAHILKYSQERLSDVSNLLGDEGVPLEIQTLGRDGLRYRRREERKISGPWQYMPAFTVSNVVDEAGAGDWCTAGIIHSLGRYGATSFWRTRTKGVERALQLGQALAAVNCRYPSARGVMYSFSLEELDTAVWELITGQDTCGEPELPVHDALHALLQTICGRCGQPE